MIIVSVVSAPSGECCQQTPPAETSDPYFDAAKSNPAPQAASSGLLPRSETPDEEAGTKEITPPPSSANRDGQVMGAAGTSAGQATRLIDQLAAQATQANVATRPPASNASVNVPNTNVGAAVENPKPRDTFEPGRVMAIVGGRPILVGDMLYEINERIEQVIPTAPEDVKEQQRQRLYAAWLTKFIDQQLLYTDVVRELPAEADLDKMFESIGKSFDEEALPDFLKKQKLNRAIDFDIYLRTLGSSLRKFRQRWIEDQFVKYFVSQKFAKDYEPTHAEMWANYQERIAEYGFPSRARWEQLVVRFDKIPDKAEARRAIAELGNKVVYGASLEAVARESSHDVKANEGGQQGWVTQGSLADAALDSTLFSIPLGELSDIVETTVGYHIVRVQERTEAGVKPFRDAQPEIKEALIQQHRAKKIEEYLTKLRREIPIEIVDTKIELPEGYSTK